MTHAMKPLGCDPSRIKGMSEKLIVSHYENNYGGAVKRLNLIEERLAGLDFDSAPGLSGQRAETGAAHCFELDGSARAVLRRPRR